MLELFRYLCAHGLGELVDASHATATVTNEASFSLAILPPACMQTTLQYLSYLPASSVPMNLIPSFFVSIFSLRCLYLHQAVHFELYPTQMSLPLYCLCL